VQAGPITGQDKDVSLNDGGEILAATADCVIFNDIGLGNLVSIEREVLRYD